MPRIRTIKPDFFRHEKLQDLEKDHPYIMLVFAGLWTISDKNGVFIYSPRTIKLDILPFLEFDIQETLSILRSNGFIEIFEHEGKKYGKVLSFVKHQRIQGKEFQEEGKYPDLDENNLGNIGETSGNVQGNTGKEGKGRERGGEVPQDFFDACLGWLDQISSESDPTYEQMLYKAGMKWNSAAVEWFKGLLATYPNMKPNTQQKLRIAFLAKQKEYESGKKNANGVGAQDTKGMRHFDRPKEQI